MRLVVGTAKHDRSVGRFAKGHTELPTSTGQGGTVSLKSCDTSSKFERRISSTISFQRGKVTATYRLTCGWGGVGWGGVDEREDQVWHAIEPYLVRFL